MESPNSTDTRAIVSLITGIAAFMFAGSITWHILSLVFGGVAVASGFAVLRGGRSGKGLAIGGLILGMIAVCIWILGKIN